MRKVFYITGTRADFGLMKDTLKKLDHDPEIELQLCITAMHLDEEFGYTAQEIHQENFKVCAEIPVKLDNKDSTSMVTAIGYEIIAMTEVFQQHKPDIVLLLGDRGETLAAAIAAAHLNIHLVHIHGGERSGTIDESVRHSISKFAHYHCTATAQSKERLVKMGEKAEHIIVTGAPGLDGLDSMNYIPKSFLFNDLGLDVTKFTGLVLFHPVIQEADSLGQQYENILKPLIDLENWQFVVLTPNADSGGGAIQEVINKYSKASNLKIHKHLLREQYLSLMKVIDVMIGNSSGAIIEAASFNLPVINIGSRQNLREQSANVINVDNVNQSGFGIVELIQEALCRFKNQQFSNIYGDGTASAKILNFIKTISLDKNILKKVNEY